ncbi:MAG: helix-turn-helix domain-containing protein [Chloroflexota bacterium]|nr:helix-turn-helix domain-containing protein [Chloroflexota bacterium]
MARTAKREKRGAPAFNPAKWASQAARRVDITACTDALVDILSSPESWESTDGDEGVRHARQQELAIALRRATPLYELTATLITPWLLEVCAPARGGGSAAEPDTGAVTANLAALMAHLFDAPGVLDYDPWSGLIEWVWSHQNALAIADLNRELGGARVRELSAQEYRRHLLAHLSGNAVAALRERSGHLLLTYAQELAKSVVGTLQLDVVTPERRDLLLGRVPLADSAELLPATRPTQLSSDVLAPLAEGHLTVMSSAHYQALREALYKGTFDRVEGNPWPTAQLSRGDLLGQAQLRPPGADGPASLREDQVQAWAQVMWHQREELSDLDADALDALSALWLSQARTVGDRAVADVDGLLTMRGIKPRSRGNGRRSGFETEQRAEMARALSHIQNIWINIAQADVPDESGEGSEQPPEARGKMRLTLQSRAFVITDRLGLTDESGAMVDMNRFVFQPGEVFARFLMGPGNQTALLSAKALKYDPYRQTFEKRLARFLSWQWRVNALGAHARPYRVDELLDAVGKEIDGRHPNWTRERLEKALDTLQEDGVIAHWQYDRWDETAVERRGWVRRWRESTLLIDPPAVVVEHYRQAHLPVLQAESSPVLVEDLPDSPDELGRLIKNRRTRLGLNQAQAGAALGVTQGYISKLERGKVPDVTPSAAFRRRLRDWLAND